MICSNFPSNFIQSYHLFSLFLLQTEGTLQLPVYDLRLKEEKELLSNGLSLEHTEVDTCTQVSHVKFFRRKLQSRFLLLFRNYRCNTFNWAQIILKVIKEAKKKTIAFMMRSLTGLPSFAQSGCYRTTTRLKSKRQSLVVELALWYPSLPQPPTNLCCDQFCKETISISQLATVLPNYKLYKTIRIH